MGNIRFKCPVCGCTEFEEILNEASVAAKVIDLDPDSDPVELEYGEIHVNRGMISQYQCSRCSQALKAEDGTEVSDQNDLFEWLEEKGMISDGVEPDLPVQTHPYSPLMEEWLGSVNQPVVNDVECRLKELVEIVTDHENFTKEQCREILIEILTGRPAIVFTEREKADLREALTTFIQLGDSDKAQHKRLDALGIKLGI